MAEIKSTMELVMERAAKMAANAAPVDNNEEQVKTGMRIAADYLDGKLQDLVAELSKQKPEDQLAINKGAVGILLRNVVLPRDEILEERNGVALKGITELIQAAGAGALNTVCSELQQILQQYGQHKEQVVEQVEEALKGQLQQQAMAKGVDPERLTASMHPQYHEEMGKVEQDLNGQYTQALDQRKEVILQQLGLN
ncbi:hypothetical protein [Desulfopila sp. IMCC35008]|uniref:hypothetical protein n=1 Tax=Desulfopila sp. IMCC35008 TaxID=2653858 RepID=UPI0013CFFBD0|nr:hypothetical protein [Desulfopila sp. IMCC35008]